jgi:HK97 family phage major capsid protein
MPLTKEDLEQIGGIAAEAATKAMSDPVRKFTPAVGVTMDEMDKKISDPRGGFKSFGHYLTDLVKVETDNHPSEALLNWKTVCKTAGYMEEGDLAQGGYTVPEEFSNKIIEKSLEESIVKPRAQFQPMASNRITIPADVDTDHSSNYFGGITLYRPGEGGLKTAKNPTFEKIALTLHKLVGLCHVTDELLEDSAIALEANLTRKFSQSIAFVEDDDYLNGTGANMPLGALHSSNPSIVTVTAVTGQGASTVIAENIMGIWARMYPQGRNKAIWLANPDCTTQLMSMVLPVGTGGVPIWMPAGGLANSPYETLMGRPLIYTEKCQAIGTAGDIALCDFSQYIIGGRAGNSGIKFATSMHFKFDYDEQSFRFVLRYDGSPTWTSTLTPKRGSNTYSPFVVLSSTRT